MNWQYRIVDFQIINNDHSQIESAEKLFNECGDKEFEAVSVWRGDGYFFVLFKKPK